MMNPPRDPNALVNPVRRGTISVMKHAAQCETVKGVVYTSSIVTIFSGRMAPGENYFTEEDWSLPTGGGSYERSKYAGEKAAFEYY